MAAPRTQYVKTRDGVRIAFSTAGAGPVLIWLHGSMLNVQVGWELPNSFRELRTRTNTVAIVDLRGTGLSDHEVGELTLAGFEADIEAVAAKLGAESFGISASGGSMKLAILYAASHPERVTELILAQPPPGLLGADDSRVMKLFVDLLNVDIETFSQNLAASMTGWSHERRERIAAAIRATTSQEAVRRFGDFLASLPVSGALPAIRCPTLIVHFAGMQYSSLEVSRELAAEIPNARLHVIEGTPMANDPDRQVGEAPRPFRTVLFTDIEAHTAMLQRLGDAKGRDVLREHERISREALRTHGGTEIKTIGDSFMASFSSAQNAVECAIALQRAFATADCAGECLRIRIGINAGEPIAEDNDLFGSSVNMAARTKEKADGGQILVTDVLRQLLSGKGFTFADRGEVDMKGFEEPVRVYEVAWQETESGA